MIRRFVVKVADNFMIDFPAQFFIFISIIVNI
jgi:hypothetical protein